MQLRAAIEELERARGKDRVRIEPIKDQLQAQRDELQRIINERPK